MACGAEKSEDHDVMTDILFQLNFIMEFIKNLFTVRIHTCIAAKIR